MKKYYLVAEKSPYDGCYQVQVTDNPRNCDILKEFEADNYVAASHRYRFMAFGLNKAVFCGVTADGNAYHGDSAEN